MPRAIKYKFGEFGFTSKDAVKKHAASIRSRCGYEVTIGDSADVTFLKDLIDCHIEAETKIGVGIKRFYVAPAPDHPGECFWIERLDGSTTDFGVPSCLNGIGSINRASLRMLIAPQIEEFRSKRLAGPSRTFTSEYSGRVFPVEEADVDHVTPFEKIVSDFFSAKEVDIETTMLTESADRKSTPKWRSIKLRDEFLDYHRRFPLRLVHRRENLSDIKKERA